MCNVETLWTVDSALEPAHLSESLPTLGGVSPFPLVTAIVTGWVPPTPAIPTPSRTIQSISQTVMAELRPTKIHLRKF